MVAAPTRWVGFPTVGAWRNHFVPVPTGSSPTPLEAGEQTASIVEEFLGH